ncbi:FAD-binding domain-containing protein [Thozetella sp. PMI_491]|nr:FAD-binding domain-containing protein [Thozetella sp. PMI_491]
MNTTILGVTLTLLALANRCHAGTPEKCKCAPTDVCWPDDSEFDALNETVSGQLIHAVPPASVCYPNALEYNPSACEFIAASWHNSTFHAADPVSIGFPWWANNTCPPLFPNGTSVNGDPDAGTKGCKIGGYPVYSLNATNISHIQAVVRFANEKNIRLNIKSTGHSFQGRSTAYGSLSVWTHNLRGAQWHEDFQPEGCTTVNLTQRAATFAAGERVRTVYEFADAHGSVIVAGSDQEVGVVGWFTGGGHGPLSSTYGMGADNVLQARVVTPTGELVTANACQNPDLFWAIRGGGGGTFGVITEVTMRAYPSPQTSRHGLTISALPETNSTTFLSLMAQLLSDLPRLKSGGMQGYMILVPPGFAGIERWTLRWNLNVYDKPNGTIESLVAPLVQWLDALNGTSVSYISTFDHKPNFLSMWNSVVSGEAVGTSGGSLGSRFLPSSALENTERLSVVLQNLTTPATGGPPIFIQGQLVANSDRRGDDVAMNPAWRDAVVHLIVTEGFPDWFSFEMAKPTIDRMTYGRVQQLRILAPDSGAYFNEGDPYDLNWQYDFFGNNFARLQAIKKMYDPNSVLWCLACIGSEEWVEVEQQSGRLCHADWADSRDISTSRGH